MEVGVSADYPAGNGTVMDKDTKSPKTVNFEQGEDQTDGRKKYLTAKYGSHQMALIRKRLHVEMWLLEEMGKLYRSGDCGGGGGPALEKELDLDELLDLEEDRERRAFLQRYLRDAAAPPAAVTRFIDELLVQAKKL